MEGVTFFLGLEARLAAILRQAKLLGLPGLVSRCSSSVVLGCCIGGIGRSLGRTGRSHGRTTQIDVLSAEVSRTLGKPLFAARARAKRVLGERTLGLDQAPTTNADGLHAKAYGDCNGRSCTEATKSCPRNHRFHTSLALCQPVRLQKGGQLAGEDQVAALNIITRVDDDALDDGTDGLDNLRPICAFRCQPSRRSGTRPR